MGNSYSGVIIEESLKDTSVLKKYPIVSTEVEQVTEHFGTPWLAQWTLHTMEIPGDQIEQFAHEVGNALDTAHKNSWYADFKDDQTHYVIFKNKVFKIDRIKNAEYDAAAAYGVSIGIPAHQLSFKEWRPKQ